MGFDLFDLICFEWFVVDLSRMEKVDLKGVKIGCICEYFGVGF